MVAFGAYGPINESLHLWDRLLRGGFRDEPSHRAAKFDERGLIGEKNVIRAFELDEARATNARREFTTSVKRHNRIVCCMKDQRWG